MRYYHFTKNFEIVYVLNFISIPVFEHMIHLIFYNPLFVTKCHFYRQKLHDPPLAATAEHKHFS